MAWFLILKRDARLDCWQLPDEHVDDELVDRARTLLGFPPGDGFIADPRFAVQLTTLDRPPVGATVRQRSELDAVTPAELAAYRQAGYAARREERLETAREAVLQLSSDERRQVYDEIPPRETEVADAVTRATTG